MAYKNPSETYRENKKKKEEKEALNQKMQEEAAERKRVAEEKAEKQKAASKSTSSTKKTENKKTVSDDELPFDQYVQKKKDQEWEAYAEARKNTVSEDDNLPFDQYVEKKKERESAARKQNSEERKIAERSPSYVSYINRKYKESDAQEEAAAQYEKLYNNYVASTKKNGDLYEGYGKSYVSEDRAEQARDEVWDASSEATQLRNYLKANRELLGDESVEVYEKGINALLSGYTDTAKRVTEDRKDYWSKFDDQQDFERQKGQAAAGQRYAEAKAGRERVESSAEEENELENEKAQAVADYMDGVKAGKYAYSESELAAIREDYDNQIAAAQKQRMKDSDNAGSYEEQYKAARDREIEAAADAGIDLTKSSIGEKLLFDADYGIKLAFSGTIGTIAKMISAISKGKDDTVAWTAEFLENLVKDAEEKVNYANRNRGGTEDYNTTVIDPETGKEMVVKNSGTKFRVGTKIVSELFRQIPDIALTIATYGGSKLLSGADVLAKKGILDAARSRFMNIIRNPLFWLSAAQEAGSAYDSAKEKGAEDQEAVLAGILTGMVNGAVEIGFGGDNAGFQTLLPAVNAGESVSTALIHSILEEGGEEGIQKFFGHVVETIMPGIEQKFSLTQEELAEYPEEMAFGALMGGIMGGGNIMLNSAVNTVAEARAQNTADPEAVKGIISRGMEAAEGSEARTKAEALQAKAEAGKRITVDEVYDAISSVNEDTKAEYVKELINQGMESAEGTESRKTAEELNAKMEAGEEITEEEILALVDANDEAFAEEENRTEESEIRKSEEQTSANQEQTSESEETAEPENEEKADAVLETVAERIGGNEEGKQMIKDLYKPEQMGKERYAAQMELAYEYGLQNYPVQEVTKKESLSGLNASQIMAAYGLGQIEMQERTERTETRKENAGSVQSVVKKAVLAEGVSLTTDEQKKARMALDLAARTTNTRIILEDAESEDSGWYDRSDGTIHINLRTAGNGGSAVLQVAAHELTHMIRSRSESEFRSLQTFLFTEYAKIGQSIETLVQDEIKAAEAARRTLTAEEALEEVVADSMETMLNDGVVLKKLAEKNPTLVEKILAKINEIIDAIKELMKGEHASTLSGTVAENLENAEAVRDKLYEALAAVANKNISYEDNVSMKSEVEVTPELIAIHNITESKLVNALRRGALIAPSLAVTNQGLHEFGEISLLFARNTIDPENSVENRLWGADAWTPTETTVRNNVRYNSKGVESFLKNQGIEENYENFTSKLSDNGGDLYAAYADDRRLQNAYLSETGKRESDLDTDAGWRAYKAWINEKQKGFISSYESGTNADVLSAMKRQPETAKKFKITPDGVLTVPSVRYDTVDDLKKNRSRLKADVESETKAVAKKFTNFARSLGGDYNTVIDAINRAFESRYSINGIREAFGGIAIAEEQAKTLQKIYREAVELPTAYFEAKPMREVAVSEIRAAVVPENASENIVDMIIKNGIDVIRYEGKKDRIRKINEQSGLMFMASRRKNGMTNTQLLRRERSEVDLSPEEIKAVRDFQTAAGQVDIQAEKLYGIQETIRSLELVDKEGNAEEIKRLSEQEYLEKATLDRMQADIRKKANGKALAGVVKRLRAEAQENTEAEAEEIRAGEIAPVEERKLSTLEAQAKEIKALKAANKSLQEKLEKTKEQLKKGDGERHIRKDDIHRMAKKLLEETGNRRMALGDVEKALTAMSDILLNNPNGDNADIEAMTRTLARDLMESAEETRDDLDSERKKLTEILRNTRVKLPENMRADIDPSYARANFWWLGTKKGAEVDEVWRELQERFGDNLFPDDIINPADQIYAIGDAIAALQPITYNPYAGMEAASEIAISNSIISGLISPEMRQEKATVKEQLENMKAEVKQINKNAKAIDRQRTALEKRLTQRSRYDMQKAVRAEMKNLVDLLTKPDKENRVMEGMRKTAAELSALVDLDSDALRMQKQRVAELTRNYNGAKTEEGKAWNLEKLKAAERRLNYLERKQKAIAEKLADDLGTGLTGDELIRLEGKGLAEKLRRIAEEYRDSAEKDGSYDEGVHEAIMNACTKVGNVPFRKLSYEALQALDDAARTVQAGIRNANRLFKAERDETVDTWAKRTIIQLREQAEIMKPKMSTTGAGGFLMWDNLKPWAAFDYMGSKTMTRLFNSLQEGEQIAARDYEEARAFAQACKKKYGYESWDMQEPEKVKCKFGKEVSLTLGERMAIYAYSKREQAAPHLMQGGFMLQSGFERIKGENGKKTYKVRNEAVYSMEQDQIVAVVNSLTKEQRDYVDAMQDYLSRVMGAKGNEVTMTMYGTRNFRERNYFPLMVSDAFIDSRLQNTEGSRLMKNAGFTKALVINAKKTVVLQDFNEVFAEHCAQMSAFHGLVLPIEDFSKVYEKKFSGGDSFNDESVKQILQETFGGNARKYIEQFMRDLNGKQSVKSIKGVDALVKVFKVSKTAANLSVIVQQPTSVYRAMAYIEPKYFRTAPIKAEKSYEECMQYAPVAIIKKMGYFDTGSGRTAASYIMEDDYEGMAGKVKGFFTDSEYRADVFGYGAEKADEITWARMWEACKRKAKAEAAPNTDEEAIKKAAGKIFNEAMVKTQVYDSVFTRSANMRKADTFSKIATSFMAEPTTTYNMMLSAVWDAKRGNKAMARKKTAGAIISTFMAAAASAAIGAMRDDEEDKTYPEKLTQAMIEDMITSSNPMNYIPILRDVLSILQGYDVARTDVEIIADIKEATEKLIKEAAEGKVSFGGVMNELAAILAPIGIPLGNIKRDVGGIYNTLMRLVESGLKWETTEEGVIRAMKEGALGRYYKAESNAEILYNAYISGNTAEINRAMKNFKNTDAAQTALKQQLRANDQRLKDAAEAMAKGDTRTYQNKINAVINDGVFGKKLVVDAANAQVSAINTAVSDYTEAYLSSDEETMAKKEAALRKMVSESYADELIAEARKAVPEEAEEESSEGYVSIFKPANVADAMETGDIDQALEIMNDLIETAGGDAEAEKKIKSSVKSAITRRFKQAYTEGTPEERRRIRNAMKETGLYDDIDDYLEGWA